MMYVKKAGTLILMAVIIIWAVSNYPHSAAIDSAAAVERVRIEKGAGSPAEKKAALDELEYRTQSEQLQHSIAGRVGKVIEPAIAPLGFDWRIGIALVTGLAAKEVVVSTMGTIYALGETDESSAELATILKNDPAFSRATALSLMVFVLLYIPCVAAVGVMKKEIGQWKPVLLYSVFVLALAWALSFITYRAALLML